MEFQSPSGPLAPGVCSFSLNQGQSIQKTLPAAPSSNPKTPAGIPEIILTGSEIKQLFLKGMKFDSFKTDTDNGFHPEIVDLTDIYIPDLALQLTPLDPLEIR